MGVCRFRGFLWSSNVKSFNVVCVDIYRLKILPVHKYSKYKNNQREYIMALTFKEFMLQEDEIPTVWDSRLMNVRKQQKAKQKIKKKPEVEDEEAWNDALAPSAGLPEPADEDTGADFEKDKTQNKDVKQNIPQDQNGEEPQEEEGNEKEDPNFQGVIRTVKNAHLVYKRQNEDGEYNELWIYMLDTPDKDELETRRNILAGTDIPQGKKQSEDGEQRFELWTVGNIQWLLISGLPN